MLLTGLMMCLACGNLFSLRAQEAQRAQEQPLNLVWADVFRYETMDGQTVTLLIGNVVLQQGETELQCDRVTHFRAESRYLFEGRVRIIEPGRVLETSKAVYLEHEQVFRCERSFTLTYGDTVLSADAGEYRKADSAAVCRGRVRYEDGRMMVQGDSAVYKENYRTIDMTGNVHINIPEDQVLVTGETAFFALDSQWTRVAGTPRLERRRSEGQPPLLASGDTITFVESPFRVTISGRSSVHQGALEAHSDSVMYSRIDEAEDIALRGEPRILHRRQTLEGRTIDIAIRDDTLRQVIAVGRAEARMPADTAAVDSSMNIVRGTTLTLFFEQNQIERLTAERNAEGLYYDVTDGAPASGTLVRGEMITVLFQDDRFTRVLVAGGGTGTFYPSHLLHTINAKEPTEHARQR